MSRIPNTVGQYEYSNHTTTPYCYEDTEGYVGDYSESDAMSDAQPMPQIPQDVKEIYRRQNAVTTSQHEHLYSQDYYYHQPVTTNQVQHTAYRKPITQNPPVYRTRITLPMDRERYLETETPEDYGDYVFRSNPQITNMTRTSPVPPAPVTSASGLRTAARRHPIAVRTPRYYKRNLYKGPSYLCLPIAYQPDPAVVRRPKRAVQERQYYQRQTANEVYYPHNKTTVRRTCLGNNSETMDDARKYDHCGDTKLDSVLARYETVLGNDSGKGENRKAKIAQILKPKMPSSIKEKQERLNKLRCSSQKDKKPTKTSIQFGSDNANTLEVEEITADVLGNILIDLDNQQLKLSKITRNLPENSSCVDSTNEVKPRKKELDDKSVQCESKFGDALTAPVEMPKEFPKSFNYEEITQNLCKTKCEYKEDASDTVTENNRTKEVTDIMKPKTSSTNVESLSRPSVNLKSKSNVVPRMLVDDALELHRTKSYVVNLIDQALSNHFGTAVSEKYAPKEPAPPTVDPKVALEMLKKQEKIMDKDLWTDIAHAITESFLPNSKTTSNLDNKPESSSSCSCSNKLEGAYVQILKEVRWGRLKHIQREIGKLENLERFLDLCSSNSFI